MTEIELLSEYEINKYEYWASQQYGNHGIIKGLSDVNAITNEPIIKLGRCLDNKDTIATISHEEIHNTIKAILDKKTSLAFDALYYHIDYNKEGIWQDNYAILRELFIIEEQLII